MLLKKSHSLLYVILSSLIAFISLGLSNSQSTLMNLLVNYNIGMILFLVVMLLSIFSLAILSVNYSPEVYVTLFLLGFWLIMIPVIYLSESSNWIQESWLTINLLIG
jgi:formate hydrogenlyase subunit 4